jgi:hypothetical protein
LFWFSHRTISKICEYERETLSGSVDELERQFQQVWVYNLDFEALKNQLLSALDELVSFQTSTTIVEFPQCQW